MLRKGNRREGDSEKETVDLLDSDEQDKIAADLISAAHVYSKNTRRSFQFLFLGLSVLFIALLLYSTYAPYHMSHQHVFEGLVPYYIFPLTYTLTAWSMLSLSQYIKNDTKLQSLNFGLTTSSLGLTALIAFFLLGYWAFIFWINEVTNIILYWIPSTNILGLLLCLYIDRDLRGMLADAYGIDKLKYNYHGL